MQCVQVKVEIGHRATPRLKPTKEGFTHDWTVYVRAKDGSNLAHFVDKVEFHLHDTFTDPLRVVTMPPYHVSGVGYADVDLSIEIYFKNKGEPQKIKFNYNLFLQTHKPVSYVRCEKLTFVNQSDEFKKNLIKAGGVYVLPSGKAQSADSCEPPIQTESLKKQNQPSTVFSKVLALPPVDAQFADLFGSPIQVTKQKQPSIISSKEKVSDTRNKTHRDTQSPTNTPSPVTNSKQGECSVEKSTRKIDSICEVKKSKRKTVRKYVKTKSSSSSECKKDEKENDTMEKSSKRQTIFEIITDPKNSEQRKRPGSPVSSVDTSMAKKQRAIMKHFSNVTPKEQKEDLSFPIEISSESDDDFLGDLTRNDKGAADLDIIPTCGIGKSSNQIYSRSALKQQMNELDDDSADDDIIDNVNVFSQPKSPANNSLKKTHHSIQLPTNIPSPVTISKESECSKQRSTCTTDSMYAVKSKRKTVRKYVKTKSVVHI